LASLAVDKLWALVFNRIELNKMKIINLVLNEFTNDSRVLKTSQSLKKIGHHVQVVALHNQGLLESENVYGIQVHRIVLKSKTLSKKKIVQVFKFIEFCIRFKINYGKTEIIHCNDLDALLVGVICKAFNWKTKLIYDSHEYAINDAPNQSKISIRLKYWLEKFLIKFAAQVINVSDSIASEYVKLYSIPKPHLVLNCPNYTEQIKYNIFRETFNIRKNQTIFLYQGGLTHGRGIELLLETFGSLTDDSCVLVCMGYGPLTELIAHHAASNDNIFLHDAVSPKILLNYTSSADFGISFIEDLCLSYRFCLPNKIFEYLMAGIPLLTSNLLEMRRLVEIEGVGVVAESNTIEEFRQAINASLLLNYTDVQKNIFRARRKYCWEEQEKVLQEVYGAA
jgi:glycosyltransferase involved in cell wall biosynthesis